MGAKASGHQLGDLHGARGQDNAVIAGTTVAFNLSTEFGSAGEDEFSLGLFEQWAEGVDLPALNEREHSRNETSDC